MRLVCPNCGAQYEVPDDVIPEAGRDVQCSNCGDTWFQPHPDHEPGFTEELDETAAAATVKTEPEPVSEPTPEPQPNAPRRRRLDPSVADVLKEEAAREEEARRRESAPLEEQPDLGLQEPEDDASRRQRQAQNRMARIRGEEVAAAGAAASAGAAATGSRRDVLPDIDEINSTLRKDSNRRKTATEVAAEMEPALRKRGGFRRGFMLILLLTVIGLALYIFAPQISAAVPALAPYMESYVLAVNEGRAWLDDKMRTLLTMLDNWAASSKAPAIDAAAEAAADTSSAVTEELDMELELEPSE